MRKLKVILNLVFGNKEKRYESRHLVLDGFSRLIGFRLYNKNLRWHKKNTEYFKIWRKFPEADNDVHERRFNLYFLAKGINSIEGNTAECGVWKGAGSYLILSAMKNYNKKHFIFDSFEGLSEPNKKDRVKTKEAYEWKKNDLSYSENLVRKNLRNFNNVEYFKGWIPEKFNEVKNDTFCFVHIDVDLYQPTKDSLEFFYNKVNKGGIILCDDYGSELCPGAFKAMNEFFQDKEENIIELTTGQGFIIKK